MKITLLNGNMKEGSSDFSAYIEKLSEKLREKHSVDSYTLNKMNLHYCYGCWSCWCKIPGKCEINDDAEKIFKSYINSDFAIFASPLIAGFTSSALKKITDRLIVLLHPYTKLKNGEIHHLKRYNRYPNFGLVLEKEADTDNEDLNIVNDIYDRFAINFHCEKKFTKYVDIDKVKDIIYETCNI